MAEYKEISSAQALSDILEESCLREIIIFKHSTSCSISAKAWGEVQAFIKDSPATILVAMIKVIESRPISNQVAEELGIKHQSPQALLLSNRQVLWNASHHAITQTSIKKALEGEISPFKLNG